MGYPWLAELKAGTALTWSRRTPGVPVAVRRWKAFSRWLAQGVVRMPCIGFANGHVTRDPSTP